MGDAAHFVLGIGHEVIALAAAIIERADRLLAEIDIAIELAHDQDVDGAGNLWPQCGEVLQPGEHGGGPEVGEQAQRRAQPQDRLFGPQVSGQRIARRIAHRAEQHRIGTLGQLQRGGRQRVAVRLVGRAAHRTFADLDAGQGQRIQHAAGFHHDFRADAVSGEGCNLHLSIRSSNARRRWRAAITSARRSASRYWASGRSSASNAARIAGSSPSGRPSRPP